MVFSPHIILTIDQTYNDNLTNISVFVCDSCVPCGDYDERNY
jgi:hypothetical protein